MKTTWIFTKTITQFVLIFALYMTLPLVVGYAVQEQPRRVFKLETKETAKIIQLDQQHQVLKAQLDQKWVDILSKEFDDKEDRGKWSYDQVSEAQKISWKLQATNNAIEAFRFELRSKHKCETCNFGLDAKTFEEPKISSIPTTPKP